MKKILSLVVLGIFLNHPAYADLSKQDVEEIRKIIKEEIQHIDKRIEGVDKRIEGVDKRIDDLRQEMNTRIDDLKDLMLTGFGILFAGMFALVGFVIWDRRTALAPAVKRVKELEEREDRLEKAIKEFAWKEPRLAQALRSVGL
ncbi:MAG: hypothetical protein AB1414_01685 [bacterium]